LKKGATAKGKQSKLKVADKLKKKLNPKIRAKSRERNCYLSIINKNSFNDSSNPESKSNSFNNGD
jgi:hypothetical protein